jgi:hypothetical protein
MAPQPLNAGEDAWVQENLSVLNAVVGDEESTSETEDADVKVTQPTKTVPSPNGRNGNAPHQEGVAEAEAKLEAKYGADPNIEIRTEGYIKTPDGKKSARFIDVVAVDLRTGRIIEGIQVGRQTGTGVPVSRERDAIEDIKGVSPDLPVDFSPYN